MPISVESARADESRRVRDQELRSMKREDLQRERLDRLETMVRSQHEKLDRLEHLVYRVMHRDRLEYEASSASPKYEEDLPVGEIEMENSRP